MRVGSAFVPLSMTTAGLFIVTRGLQSPRPSHGPSVRALRACPQSAPAAKREQVVVEILVMRPKRACVLGCRPSGPNQATTLTTRARSASPAPVSATRSSRATCRPADRTWRVGASLPSPRARRLCFVCRARTEWVFGLSLVQVDFYRKIPTDLTEATMTGATMSICAWCVAPAKTSVRRAHRATRARARAPQRVHGHALPRGGLRVHVHDRRDERDA